MAIGRMAFPPGFQGRSWQGLEAQRQVLAEYVSRPGGEVVAELQEVESVKPADRPPLTAVPAVPCGLSSSWTGWRATRASCCA